MKVLITGSSGFIGHNTKLWLQWGGHEVAGIDRVANPEYLGSVESLISRAIYDFKPDVVLHLAAKVTRADCEHSPFSAIDANTKMTTFVARECARNQVRLAYSSTSEVYGDRNWVLLDEKSGTSPTSGVYGMTKLWGEQVVQHFCDRPLIMRLCMAYGPDMPVGPGKAALPTFIYNAIRGERITVHRGANRSWCFINDTARAIRTLLEQDRDGVWNVGRDDELVSMFDVARYACRLAGADESLIDVIDPPALQTAVKRISCAKLARETGWRPTTNIDEGMRLCHVAALSRCFGR